jgi:DNA-binding transcriptional MerR regulator
MANASQPVLTIGELARESGVTPESIRYYEREGIVPRPSRKGSGRYRQYGPADVERLSFVRRARELGFTLTEVRELLGLGAGDPAAPCAAVNTIARGHLQQVNAKLAQLTALRNELTRLIAACDRNVSLADCTLLAALSGRD